MKPRIRRCAASSSSKFAALLSASLACYAAAAAAAAAAAVEANPRADEYHERLDIRPLDDGKILSRFDFTVRSYDAAWEGVQYDDSDSIAGE